ncbi:MAG: hypothetical protein KKH70_20465 [Gammaproteobacteria bacterium]|nr:hypothetical protein [Gammaproteobacteria bacterium]
MAKDARFMDKTKKGFDRWLAALYRGDMTKAIQAKDVERRFRPIAQRMAYEYANMGGLSPETKAQIATYQQPRAAKGEEHNDALNMFVYPHMMNQLRQLGQQIPTVTGTGGERQVQLYMRPPEVSMADFMRMHATNVATQYQDPTTRAETLSYLSRENPFLFRGYSNVPTAAPPTGSPSMAQQAATIGQAATAMDYDALIKALPGSTQAELGQTSPSSLEPRSALNWLQNYLRTAAQGFGGTREQQRFAQERLKTMEEEAKSKQNLANWLTLGQNIVNPVMARGGGETGFGQQRALIQPPGTEFQRRGVRRSVSLT